jgi:uncharacterized cofD-like protein
VRVVGIGGGHGLAASLRAARRYASDVHAVVTVADDGGSSGRLTRELGIPPPGDIRNCLVALADGSELSRLFQHRFDKGVLVDHAVGNLLIAALAEEVGDFTEAVQRAGRLIGARGHVYPATTELVGLRARVGGREVRGQVAVAQAPAAIQAVYLDPPSPAPEPRAVEAIVGADQVVLGPGSLFTSLIATLVVPGIRAALRASRARRVFVCNARMQRGETRGFDAAAHVSALLAHAGAQCLDAVVVQSPVQGGQGVSVNRDQLDFFGVDVVEADVASPSGAHDPARLAAVLASLT